MRTSATEPADEPLAAADRKAKGIQSIVIGFGVLEKIAGAKTPLALRDLASITGMAASKLRFYLVSFLELGLVSQDPASGKYSLGPAALRLGLAALEKVDVVRTSRGEMAALSDAVGYTTFLAVWGTHGPTIVDRVDGRSRTVLEIRVGSVLPLTVSAIGLVYTAFLPHGATETLLKRELKEGMGAPRDKAISATQLLKVQEKIRESRFAVASGSLLAGFTAIASPILDRSETPVAVISICGPIGRMDDSAEGEVGRALLEFTRRLSLQIGWRPSA